jgi:uncharacterized protein YjiK
VDEGDPDARGQLGCLQLGPEPSDGHQRRRDQGQQRINYFATLGEYDMNGNFLATITVNGCQTFASQKCDPEGLTYVGGNNYVIGSERVQDMFKVTSATTDGDRTYTSFDTAQRISVSADAGNKGLEGVAYRQDHRRLLGREGNRSPGDLQDHRR